MKNEVEENQLEGVMPSEFFLTIGGKKRQVKFGNLALAKVEQKYGSVQDFDKLTEDITKRPMQTIPWLLSISLRDKEGLDFSNQDAILEAMDDANLSVKEVMEVVTKSMNSSMAHMFGSKK